MPRHIRERPISAAPALRCAARRCRAWDSCELLPPRRRSLPDLEQGEKRLLRNLNASDLLHPFLAFFLLLEELAFPGDVAAIAFCGDILAQRLDALPRDDFGPDTGLDGDLEHLAR